MANSVEWPNMNALQDIFKSMYTLKMRSRKTDDYSLMRRKMGRSTRWMTGFTKSRSSQNSSRVEPRKKILFNKNEEFWCKIWSRVVRPKIWQQFGIHSPPKTFKKIGQRSPRDSKDSNRPSNLGECNPNALILKVWDFFFFLKGMWAMRRYLLLQSESEQISDYCKGCGTKARINFQPM